MALDRKPDRQNVYPYTPLDPVRPRWHSEHMPTPSSDPAHPVEVVKLRELTDTERAVLDLESTWFKYAGRKEQVIRERFDMSTTRYYQVLRGLLQREEAMAYDPLLVRRLIRQQESRARSRSAKRLPR